MSIQSVTSQNMIIQPTDLNSPEATNELGEEAFLNILMTQLKYQDPLDPMDNTEFISQLAEFNTLEQMQSMNTTLSSMQVFSMMGKTVTFNTIDQSTGIQTLEQGTVESAVYKDGKANLIVNGKEIDVNSVVEITETQQNDESSI